MLCERENVTATSVEICEGIVEKQPSTPTLRNEATWQTTSARMDLLPARPAIDCDWIVPSVCMMTFGKR